MLKDRQVRRVSLLREEQCWPSPRLSLSPLRPQAHPQHHATPRYGDLSQVWAPVPPPRAVKKPARAEAHPRLTTPGAWPLPPRGCHVLEDPSAGLGRPSALEAASTGAAPAPGAPLRSLGPGRSPAFSVFLRIPEEERNQRLGIEKQG